MAHVGCPYCNWTRKDDDSPCPNCGKSFSAAQATVSTGAYFCTSCGAVGNPRSYQPGSYLVMLLLCLLMLLPGILYFVWMLVASYQGCPRCKAKNMIPIDSPVAQAALAAQRQTPVSTP